MPYQLIPLPLSIIFIVVFAFAVELVLWKLRRNGKIYKLLFNLGLVASLVATALILVLLFSTYDLGY